MNEDGVYLDIVIVDANPNPSRTYFEGGWDEDASSPPTCFSDNGVAPSTQATQPQSPTCAGCPQAVWGSAVSKLTQQPIPACSTSKKLAVLVVGDPDELIYEFVIPPGSWSDKNTGWKRYTQSLAGVQVGNRSADLSDIITRVYFVQGKMGVMGFKPVSMITQELADAVDEAWASGQTARICGIDDKPRDTALPVAPKPQALAAPVQSAPQAPPPPPPAPAAEKKRGRPAKAAQEPPAAPIDIPPFLQARPGAPTPNVVQSPNVVQPTPAQAAPQPGPQPTQAQQSVLVEPLAVPDDLNATLKQLFALPT